MRGGPNLSSSGAMRGDAADSAGQPDDAVELEAVGG